MKIFTLSDASVRSIRQNHPILKGKKLIASGQFSGVFEGSRSDTVLKLSIDNASYAFHFDSEVKVVGEHFVKGLDDYGVVGQFVTSRNVTRTAFSNPIELTVPIYLYEVERLEKIPASTDNRSLAMRLTKDWRNLDRLSPEVKLCDRARWIIRQLRIKGIYSEEIIESLDEIATFLYWYEQDNEGGKAFVDLHGMNFMQRSDGTFVFSDPVGDLRIYNSHYTFRLPDTAKVA